MSYAVDEAVAVNPAGAPRTPSAWQYGRPMDSECRISTKDWHIELVLAVEVGLPVGVTGAPRRPDIARIISKYIN